MCKGLTSEFMRGHALSQNRQEVLDRLSEIAERIGGNSAAELPVSELTTGLIIALTETDDEEILDAATDVSAQFLEKIERGINEFPAGDLPTVFSSLQLFAVEPGQYGFETVDNPDSDINRLTGSVVGDSDSARIAYTTAQEQLKSARDLRALAISALIRFFGREEFSGIAEYVEGELLPMISSLNDDRRYRPFRTSLAANIADKLYRFEKRTGDHDPALAGLLHAIFEKKYIKFGTSGFRAFVNKDFTGRRSDFVTAAICNDLEVFQGKRGLPVVITHDTRIGAREFALESARVFLARGFPVRFSEEPSPTGALVYWLREVEDGRAAGGENMTPSHNPLSTQGQRWSMGNGDVAPTSVTDRIEREANLICMREPAIEKYDLKEAQSEGRFAYIDMREKYTAWVADFLKSEELDRILRDFYSQPENRFIHNAMNGVARGYITEIFERLGIPTESVFPMDSEADELLGLRFYANPEEQWLLPTMDRLNRVGALFLCGNDTDGDRCGGILDAGGFTNLNKLLAMLCDFVIRGLGWENHIVIRTGTTSTALDDVVEALKRGDGTDDGTDRGYDIPTPEWDQVNSLVRHPFYNLALVSDDREHALSLERFPCVVTEVGFKYISAAIAKYGLPAAVAGEESGGFTIKRFPDKDGIIGICMIASMIAWHGAPPGEIWRRHTERYREKYDARLDIWAPNAPKEKIINSWLDNPPEEIAGQKVLWAGGTYHDKVEFVLQGQKKDGSETISRLLVRASGTEEINRIYIESGDEPTLGAIRRFALDRLNDLIAEDIGAAANYHDLSDRIASTGMTFMTEPARERYFDLVRAKMDALAALEHVDPITIYRRVLRLLTLEMDRDTNVRHAAWGVDIGLEFYRRIFPVAKV
ncbi:MAG: hypothetical protein J7J06_05485 [Methanosarcinales archaeon]|nr:hypothetical protein [Methanosarcinales archaeon]